MLCTRAPAPNELEARGIGAVNQVDRIVPKMRGFPIEVPNERLHGATHEHLCGKSLDGAVGPGGSAAQSERSKTRCGSTRFDGNHHVLIAQASLEPGLKPRRGCVNLPGRR